MGQTATFTNFKNIAVYTGDRFFYGRLDGAGYAMI